MWTVTLKRTNGIADVTQPADHNEARKRYDTALRSGAYAQVQIEGPGYGVKPKARKPRK